MKTQRDSREALDFDLWYTLEGAEFLTKDIGAKWVVRRRCTFCKEGKPRFIIKRHWANRPKGQLLVYCNEHQR